MAKYTLEVTEEQLRLIANCVEDCSRFMSGQTELWHMTSNLENYSELRDKLNELKPLVTPELSYNASYGWSGSGCPNKHQRKIIAMSYAIYREILHRLAVDNQKEGDSYNVYLGATLTCEEGGELPKIKRL